MPRKPEEIEHDIWVAAFLRGLTQKSPDAARELAAEAVEMYRDFTCLPAPKFAADAHGSAADEPDYVPGEVLSAESYFYEDMLRDWSESWRG